MAPSTRSGDDHDDHDAKPTKAPVFNGNEDQWDEFKFEAIAYFTMRGYAGGMKLDANGDPTWTQSDVTKDKNSRMYYELYLMVERKCTTLKQVLRFADGDGSAAWLLLCEAMGDKSVFLKYELITELISTELNGGKHQGNMKSYLTWMQDLRARIMAMSFSITNLCQCLLTIQSQNTRYDNVLVSLRTNGITDWDEWV